MEGLFAEAWRFAVFATIGVFNTAFDMVVWRSAVWVLEKNPSAIATIHARTRMNQYSVAQVFSTIIAGSLSFVLNRVIAFADVAVQTDVWQVLRFFCVTGASMVISTVGMQFLTETNWVLARTRRYQFVSTHWPIICKLLTVAMTMVINFIGYRLFVF